MSKRRGNGYYGRVVLVDMGEGYGWIWRFTICDAQGRYHRWLESPRSYATRSSARRSWQRHAEGLKRIEVDE
jgi:hypothetical protein